MGSEIRRLEDDSIRRIVAEQAVTDLSSIVKELVDNALDAESNTIKVRLFGQGLDIIEVSDDGTGVPPESRPFLAQRYATSKIQSFEDIYSGTGLTMGFRGEALFSMACLSQKLIISTRTEDDEMAQKLEFKRDGSLDTDSVQDIHRKIGSTVAVVGPFASLPARRVDLMRRIRAERSKLFRLLESYAIFNVGVQLNLIDITAGGREDIALATSSSSTKIEETISSVMGHKFLASLTPFKIDFGDLLKREDNGYSLGIEGMISKNPKGDLPNRIINYYSINGRVVELPKVTSILRRVWNGFGARKKPSCVLSLTLPNDCFDINLSPDKQQVLLTHEHEIYHMIEEKAIELWANQSQGVFQLQHLDTPVEDVDDSDPDRQMHKRRYAFVHDLGNAKLQHHSEDRHKFSGTDKQENAEDKEGKRPRSESESNDAPVSEVPPEKKAKVVSDGGEQDTLGSQERHSASMSEPLDKDIQKATDFEKRKWTEMQTVFNSTGSRVSRQSHTQPVTPDDESSELESLRKQPQQRPVSVREADQKSNGQSKDTVKQSKQLSLQQFAFRADETHDRRSSSRKISPVDNGSRRTERTARTPAVSRRVIAKSQAVTEPTDASTTPDDEPNGDSSENSRESDHDANQEVDSDEEENEETSNSNTAASKNQVEETTKTTVWTAFKGITSVCERARSDRVQMIKRKLDLKDSADEMAAPVAPVLEEAKEISESVGEPSSQEATSISLSKEQFRQKMEILGQFNLGFILARCPKNHLWILDQHACDEKFNFEQLCNNTKIHEQRLLMPMQLDLSAAEESCILDHMTIFEANGFRFDFQPDGPIRQRLSLTALPHSGAQDGRKAVQFGKDDVRTLCSILMEGSSYDAGDGGTGTDGSGMYGNNAVRRYASTASSQYGQADRIIARLPKAIAMFASRACRTSIMIGTALSQKEMKKIVSRLADVDHPWNCPHGRPTMRHVASVRQTFLEDERKASSYMTTPTVIVAPLTQDVVDENQPYDEMMEQND